MESQGFGNNVMAKQLLTDAINEYKLNNAKHDSNWTLFKRALNRNVKNLKPKLTNGRFKN